MANKILTPVFDLNLSPGKPVLNKDIEYLKQEIDILFDSTPGDLHGDIEYGTDYEYLLFELKLDETQLRARVLRDVREMDLRGFEPEVEVYLMEGTKRDIAIIDITLSRNYERYTKQYRII